MQLIKTNLFLVAWTW